MLAKRSPEREKKEYVDKNQVKGTLRKKSLSYIGYGKSPI